MRSNINNLHVQLSDKENLQKEDVHIFITMGYFRLLCSLLSKLKAMTQK